MFFGFGHVETPSPQQGVMRSRSRRLALNLAAAVLGNFCCIVSQTSDVSKHSGLHKSNTFVSFGTSGLFWRFLHWQLRWQRYFGLCWGCWKHRSHSGNCQKLWCKVWPSMLVSIYCSTRTRHAGSLTWKMWFLQVMHKDSCSPRSIGCCFPGCWSWTYFKPVAQFDLEQWVLEC